MALSHELSSAFHSFSAPRVYCTREPLKHRQSELADLLLFRATRSILTITQPVTPEPQPPKSPSQARAPPEQIAIMISDDDLYRLALFLGSAAMVLIVGYHYIEVNAKDDEKATAQRTGKQGAALK